MMGIAAIFVAPTSDVPTGTCLFLRCRYVFSLLALVDGGSLLDLALRKKKCCGKKTETTTKPDNGPNVNICCCVCGSCAVSR